MTCLGRSVAAQTCPPAWSDDYGLATILGDVHAYLSCITPDNESLIVAGQFENVSGIPAKNIARWDGQEWSALGNGLSGMDNRVHALIQFDQDSDGDAEVFAGGSFNLSGAMQIRGIAQWNGSAWTAVGGGVNDGGIVYALAVFDDGSGPALYAAGAFTQIGGMSAFNIAKWNGTAWSAVGNTNAPVRALAVHNDGTSSKLYAGGDFTVAGGQPAARIACWDGAAWHQLDSGVNGNVFALKSHAMDQKSPSLFVGGEFTFAGQVLARRIAQWSGNAWSALGEGMFAAAPAVLSLEAFDFGEGAGPELVAGGTFQTAGDVPASFVARWNGSQWNALGNGASNPVRAIGVHHTKQGPALHIQGGILAGGGKENAMLSRWAGSHWTAIGNGFNGVIYDFEVFDDGAESALYVAGVFTIGGGISASHIIKWNGENWSALPGAFTNAVGIGAGVGIFDLLAWDGKLYVAGVFAKINGMLVNNVAAWNGNAWSNLGTGVTNTSTEVSARAMMVFDHGTGEALHIGGYFSHAGGTAANSIARWNGTSWSPLGTGLTRFPSTLAYCHALAVMEVSGSPMLIAGGQIDFAGGTSVENIAKWNGSNWSALADGGVNSVCRCLRVFQIGGVTSLYAGGDFISAGGSGANHVARWNGQAWFPLGAGVSGASGAIVYALAMFDDGAGDGPQLHVAGEFTAAGGNSANRVAKWTGSQWLPLAGGITSGISLGWATAMATFANPDGTGSSLYVGGHFLRADGISSSRIARWSSHGPSIENVAADSTVPAGSAASFSVSASGVEPLSYQWQRNGIDVVDGPFVSGSTSAALTINPVHVADAGEYLVIVSDECGMEVSRAATFIVTTCAADTAPFLGDGVVHCDDLLAVLNAWGTTDHDADLNDDGLVGIDDLMMVILLWGPCSS